MTWPYVVGLADEEEQGGACGGDGGGGGGGGGGAADMEAAIELLSDTKWDADLTVWRPPRHHMSSLCLTQFLYSTLGHISHTLVHLRSVAPPSGQDVVGVPD